MPSTADAIITEHGSWPNYYAWVRNKNLQKADDLLLYLRTNVPDSNSLSLNDCVNRYWNGDVMTLVRRTTDAAPVNNSTTFVLDPVLRFPVVPGNYEWELVVFYTGGDTGDLRLSFDVPVGTTGIRYELGPGTTLTIAAGLGQWEAEAIVPGSPGVHQNIFGAVAVAQMYASLRCAFMTVVNAGEFVVHYAQQPAAVENLVIKANSFIRYQRV